MNLYGVGEVEQSAAAATHVVLLGIILGGISLFSPMHLSTLKYPKFNGVMRLA